MLKEGLYEKVINRLIDKELAERDNSDLIDKLPIDAGEAANILASYAKEVVKEALDNVTDRDKENGLEKQVALVNRIIETVAAETGEESFMEMTVSERAEELLALLSKENSVYAISDRKKITRPQSSIARSTIFTAAQHEPKLYEEMKREIPSCDRIDMLVSFIKWSGFRLLREQLEAFVAKGGKLRVITTTYMKATDIGVVVELGKLPNTEIKISYDTQRTRLHAKTYIFHRDSGFSTAYVGSSNLSAPAISAGLEWNVKVTRNDLPDTFDKIEATFESYWASDDFKTYTPDQYEELHRALNPDQNTIANINFPFEIKPYPYQNEILDKLDAERNVHGKFRNLLVAATGTGKTVVSAFDYKRFCTQEPRRTHRLLFIVHREEILKQSLATFRGILRDANFGELFVGSCRPDSIDHLFMSIQTFNSQDFCGKTSPDYYDYIIVDEFHHAAAASYKKLLNYYTPRILLGMTATPERMDGKSILPYFDNRIAAEIRLPEAIDRKLLCPFQYFGVTDEVDVSGVKWTNGGYDKGELSKLYTLDGFVAKRRAALILNSVNRYVADLDMVRGLGFCVSMEHANFMSKYFNDCGVPSAFLTATSAKEERDKAKQRLVSGEVKFIFVVDLYNEGVDIPEVNTVLFLRPTESMTVFLQQLGRGLRLAEGKEYLTVLDFIGQANKRYRFEEKYQALLKRGGGVATQIENGFPELPAGCYIQLEKRAQEYVLSNIRATYGMRRKLVERIANFRDDSGKDLTLSNFLGYYHMDVRELYACDSFSRLCQEAGERDDFKEPLESTLKKAFPRFATVNSRNILKFWARLLTEPTLPGLGTLTDGEKRMLQMLQFTVWQRPYADCGFTSLLDGIRSIRENEVLCAELVELLEYNYAQIDFTDIPVSLDFDCPLSLYCDYTRDQLLVAMDFLKPSTVREGVKYLPEHKIDIALVTLNKSDKDYSPTTMYQDYSIGKDLFHWQSQSTTSDTSPTGQRYIHHRELGTTFLLFVRENKKDRVSGEAGTYTFLGKANYVQHTGSKPMNIVWKLEYPLPARLQQKTNESIGG